MRRRPRPIDPLAFTPIAIVVLVNFVFQLVTLLFVSEFAHPANLGIGRLFIIDTTVPQTFIANPGFVVRGDGCTPAELARYHPILSRELSRYGDSLLKKIRLRRIILCATLTADGEEQAGLALGPEGTIYLDVRPLGGNTDSELSRTIHHEIFHVIDAMLQPAAGSEQAWTKLNPKDFHYGGDEVLEALTFTDVDPHQRSETLGLIDYYAMVSASEDRAVLFSSMMVAPDELKAIAAEDKIIAEKIAHLRRELLRLSPAFDSLLR